jgi:hypothetical protein
MPEEPTARSSKTEEIHFLNLLFLCARMNVAGFIAVNTTGCCPPSLTASLFRFQRPS